MDLLNRKERKIVEDIAGIIRKNKRFLITAHTALDGDSLGCETALFFLLKRLKKEAAIVNEDRVPEMYGFVPGARQAKAHRPGLKPVRADVVFILDCGAPDRIGKVRDILPSGVPVVVIDHHAGKSSFGDVNWTDASYSATGEMLYHVIAAFGKIPAREAACLYTAILTDTGSFQYHFGKKTFAVAQELLSAGIDPQAIAARIYFEKPLRSVKLLGLALATLRFDAVARACWMRITREMYREAGAREEDTERFVDVLRQVREADVIFILKERSDGIKASFRSRRKVDVNKIAGVFGGGGHKEAAGCTLKNTTMEAAERKILAALK